jgi:hypothetical protein
VHLDPQPIPVELDRAGNEFIPSGDAIKSGSGMARLGEIAEVALRSSNDEIRERCGSGMIPYSPETIHRGCPSESELVLVIGHAWPVERSRLDSLKTPLVGAGAGGVFRSVRVIETLVSPKGRTTVVWDYVVLLDRGRWRLASRISRLYLD